MIMLCIVLHSQTNDVTTLRSVTNHWFSWSNKKNYRNKKNNCLPSRKKEGNHKGLSEIFGKKLHGNRSVIT